MRTQKARIEYLCTSKTPSAANVNSSQKPMLSDSEARILLLLQAGKDNAEIGAKVGVDQAAVKEHIKSILRKAVDYRNRTGGAPRIASTDPASEKPIRFRG